MPSMFNNGNMPKHVYADVTSTQWKKCGVLWYIHPTHGLVYLAYNLLYLKVNPVPTTPMHTAVRSSRRCFALHYFEYPWKPIAEDSTKTHLKMKLELFDPKRFIKSMTPMFTDGNKLKFVKSDAFSTQWKKCGVLMYIHPTHGLVYLVYNPLYLKVNPVPTIIK
jgi:hypothetical protein